MKAEACVNSLQCHQILLFLVSSSVRAALYPLSHRLKLTLGVSGAQNALQEEKRCLVNTFL